MVLCFFIAFVLLASAEASARKMKVVRLRAGVVYALESDMYI
jgi:hypothetical protein